MLHWLLVLGFTSALLLCGNEAVSPGAINAAASGEGTSGTTAPPETAVQTSAPQAKITMEQPFSSDTGRTEASESKAGIITTRTVTQNSKSQPGQDSGFQTGTTTESAESQTGTGTAGGQDAESETETTAVQHSKSETGAPDDDSKSETGATPDPASQTERTTQDLKLQTGTTAGHDAGSEPVTATIQTSEPQTEATTQDPVSLAKATTQDLKPGTGATAGSDAGSNTETTTTTQDLKSQTGATEQDSESQTGTTQDLKSQTGATEQDSKSQTGTTQDLNSQAGVTAGQETGSETETTMQDSGSETKELTQYSKSIGSTQTVSSTTRPVKHSSSSDDTGGKVALGICIPVLIVLVAVLVIYVLRKTNFCRKGRGYLTLDNYGTTEGLQNPGYEHFDL